VPHLEPDRLVLLALGEDLLDDGMTDHLLECEICRRELDDLRTVAGVARRTQEVRELPAPPPRVWSGIAQATAGTPKTAAGGPGRGRCHRRHAVDCASRPDRLHPG
jgi:hypothetical protein